MMHTSLRRALIVLACQCVIVTGCATTSKHPAQTFVFESADGQTTDAIHGSLQVPENRADPDSRMLTLRYVRFPATTKNPGAPIIYLAGGPGGSGIDTAKQRRFPLFMAMRQFGDVIALDQRGTGASDDTPVCQPSKAPSESEALSDDAFVGAYRAAALECAAFWKTKGVDLRGYNTNESVDDLDALRRHLSADKITLWGISYGSHLALAALKRMDDRLDRVVIASAEGLDQTVKLPARTDAYFDRLQAVVNDNPQAQVAYPDIKALIARVHAKLQAMPVMLHLKDGNGANTDLLLQRRSLQMIEGGAISDPEGSVLMLAVYRAIDSGDYKPISDIMQKYFSPGAPMEMRAMPLAMDVASGISDERLALVGRQAKTALLGDSLNFPMPQLRDAFPQLDLGDAFRTAPVSHVPTLLLTGTLDGRTYPDSHRKAVAGLDHLQAITVVNAGHNLFMSSPAVTTAIERFMRGEAVASKQIIVPVPDFKLSPPAPPKAAVAAFAAKLLAENYSPDGPGAVILVARGDDVLYRGSTGMADVTNRIPLKADGLFRIGSLTKQFTAAGLLRLVEDGKVSLDDSLAKYVSDFPGGDAISVRQLLNHTAGVRSYTDMPGMMDGAIRKDVTTSQLIDEFKNEPPDFAPGDDYHYSNSGYALVGAVIEGASGEKWYRYLDRTFFQPLGMHNTGYGANPTIVSRQVRGYTWDDDKPKGANLISMTQAHAAGGLVSSVDDLQIWNRALHEGKVLTDATYLQMITPTGKAAEHDYGFGITTYTVRGQPMLSHGGGIFGFLSRMSYLPGPDIGIVVLQNADGMPASHAGPRDAPRDIGRRLAAAALGDPYPAAKPIALGRTALKAYEGIYRIDADNSRVLRVIDGNLTAQRTGNHPDPLTPIAKDTFLHGDGFDRIRIVRGDDNRIDGLRFYPSGDGDGEFAARTSTNLPPPSESDQ